jgi:hypothetical protein
MIADSNLTIKFASCGFGEHKAGDIVFITEKDVAEAIISHFSPPYSFSIKPMHAYIHNDMHGVVLFPFCTGHSISGKPIRILTRSEWNKIKGLSVPRVLYVDYIYRFLPSTCF